MDIKIENKYEFSEILDGYHEDYKVIEAGEWIQEHKYQYKTSVVLHKSSGKYYEGTESRSGSPFAEWEYYSDQVLHEVEKHTETRVITTWKAVK